MDPAGQVVQEILLQFCYCLRKHNRQRLDTKEDGVKFLLQYFNPPVQLLTSLLELRDQVVYHGLSLEWINARNHSKLTVKLLKYLNSGVDYFYVMTMLSKDYTFNQSS